MTDSAFKAGFGRLSSLILIFTASMAAGWSAGYNAIGRFFSTCLWGIVVAAFYEAYRTLDSDRERKQ